MAAVADTSIVGFNQSLKISDFRRRHAYAKRYLDQRRLIRNRWTGHDAARRRRIGVNFRQRGSLKALGATQDDSSESPAGLRKAFVDLSEEGHQRRHFKAR